MNSQPPGALSAAQPSLPIFARTSRSLLALGLLSVSALFGACETHTAYTGTHQHYASTASGTYVAPYSSTYVGVNPVYPRNRYERRYDRRAYRRYGAVSYGRYGRVSSAQPLASVIANGEPSSSQ